MTVALVVLACVIAFLLYERREHARTLADIEAAWRLERAGLLNRIQHPQIFQPAEADPLAPDPEAVDLMSDTAYWAARDVEYTETV